MAYTKATLAQHPSWCGRIEYEMRFGCAVIAGAPRRYDEPSNADL